MRIAGNRTRVSQVREGYGGSHAPNPPQRRTDAPGVRAPKLPQAPRSEPDLTNAGCFAILVFMTPQANTPEERLAQLGITLPPAPAGVAAYVSWVRTGDLVVTSGQLPWHDGELAFTGKLGGEVSDENGYRAARFCAINALAQLKEAAGELSKVSRIVRVEGYVHSAPGFRGHPQVLNGASELFNEVFGERGQHTRLALGINEMPLDSPIQLSVWAELTS